ncbi:hypothetical protein KKC32_02950 [Patescibacteria group bacterium]|nr:hypothetical protein [Patescibacteria group bacterium]
MKATELTKTQKEYFELLTAIAAERGLTIQIRNQKILWRSRKTGRFVTWSSINILSKK